MERSKQKVPEELKKAAVYACSKQVHIDFVNYFLSLKQMDRLPEYTYDGIPIFIRPFTDPRYDVYVSLGSKEFVYYKHIAGDKFERLKDISVD
jgi:hypothetical protein